MDKFLIHLSPMQHRRRGHCVAADQAMRRADIPVCPSRCRLIVRKQRGCLHAPFVSFGEFHLQDEAMQAETGSKSTIELTKRGWWLGMPSRF